MRPPSAQSVAEMRTDKGLSAGHCARTACKTSSGNRRRFCDAAAVLVACGGWSAARGTMPADSRAPCAARACRSPPAGRIASRARNRPRTLSMSAACHLDGRLADPLEVGQGRGRHNRPVAARQRMVHLLPAELGRALAAGVAELQADLRRRVARARTRRCAARRRAASHSKARCTPA